MPRHINQAGFQLIKDFEGFPRDTICGIALRYGNSIEHGRSEIRQVDRFGAVGVGQARRRMAMPVRLRAAGNCSGNRAEARDKAKLWLPCERAHHPSEHNAWRGRWFEKAKALPHLEGYAGALFEQEPPRLPSIRRARHFGLQRVGGIRGFQGLGARCRLFRCAFDRPHRQQWKLFARQLPVGGSADAIQEHPQKHDCRVEWGRNDPSRCGGSGRSKLLNSGAAYREREVRRGGASHSAPMGHQKGGAQ